MLRLMLAAALVAVSTGACASGALFPRKVADGDPPSAAPEPRRMTERRETTGERKAPPVMASERATVGETDEDRFRRELKRLAEKVERLESRLRMIEIASRYRGKHPWPVVVRPPKIDAKITRIDPAENVVVIAAGERHGVRPGFEFTVYRAERYVGKLVVERVEATRAFTFSRREVEARPIQVGDLVTTWF